jgi:rubrerythrin
MPKGWNLGASNAEDVFEAAAIVEQGGFDFYDRLRALAANPRVKKELEFLRDEEASHEAFFLEQLRLMGRSPRGTAGPALQGILEREFLVPLQNVFASSGVGDNYETLGFGLELEQKSIDLYAEMRAVIKETQRSALDRIIAEEEGHRRRLQLMRAYY